MNQVGIFCSSRENSVVLYRNIALQVLRILFEYGVLNVNYGGGDKGLMGIVYHESLRLGINIRGHNLERWSQPYLENEIVYATLAERQQGLVESSNVYVVLPGGIGTVYEMTQVLCNNDVDKKNKAVILYNVNHFYDGILDWMKKSADDGMTNLIQIQLYVVTNENDLRNAVQMILKK